ncbi:MAG: poly-gamma-glutamate hydrolase family protein [Actinomycetota bacterium]
MFDRLLQCIDVEEHVVLSSAVGFLALHGGLEPGTEGIAASAAAAAGASAYVVTQPRSLGWHVSSHRIVTAEVPRLAAFLDHVDVVVSVHGYFRPELPDAVFVGGGRRDLATDLAARLRAVVSEMPVVDDLQAIPKSMRGVDPRNPVNGSRGGGVQLELPSRARTVVSPGGRRDDPSVAARVTEVLVEFARAQAA